MQEASLVEPQRSSWVQAWAHTAALLPPVLVTQWGAWRELSTPVYAGSASQSLRHLYAKCSPLLGSSATPGPGGADVAQGGLVTSPAVTSLRSPGRRAVQRPADGRTRDHLGRGPDRPVQAHTCEEEGRRRRQGPCNKGKRRAREECVTDKRWLQIDRHP